MEITDLREDGSHLPRRLEPFVIDKGTYRQIKPWPGSAQVLSSRQRTILFECGVIFPMDSRIPRRRQD